MSSRVMGYALLLLAIGVFALAMNARSQQSQDEAGRRTKWEYKVVGLEGSPCSQDGQVLASLNSLGQEGWELVSYEQAAPSFPKDAEGTLLIAPAATSPSQDTTPPLADSFRGSMNLRMATSLPGGCRMILKREMRRQFAP